MLEVMLSARWTIRDAFKYGIVFVRRPVTATRKWHDWRTCVGHLINSGEFLYVVVCPMQF